MSCVSSLRTTSDVNKLVFAAVDISISSIKVAEANWGGIYASSIKGRGVIDELLISIILETYVSSFSLVLAATITSNSTSPRFSIV